MKAKVTAIHWGGEYTDGERRIELTFEGGQDVFRKLRIPERMLALAAEVQLSDELTFHCIRIDTPEHAQYEKGKIGAARESALPEIEKAARTASQMRDKWHES